MQYWLSFGVHIFVIGIILIFILYIALASLVKVTSYCINKIEYRRQQLDTFSIRREEIIVGATAALAYHSGIISTHNIPDQMIVYPKHSVSAWNLTEKIDEISRKNLDNWVKGLNWMIKAKFYHLNAGKNYDEQ